jgi:hypothetical protein
MILIKGDITAKQNRSEKDITVTASYNVTIYLKANE